MASPPGRSRPFSLWRDLNAVVGFIERAFGPDLRRNRLTRRDVNTLRIAAPFIELLSFVAPSTRDVFGGIVWEMDGKIIGNVTINRLGGDPTRWLIGNVAVEPAYQRLGIGRRPTQKSLAAIAARGGEVAVLDVRADNARAYDLYRSLGFVKIDSTAEYERGPLVAGELAAAPDRPVRPLRSREWRAYERLLKAALPSQVQDYTPVKDTQVLNYRAGREHGAGWGTAGRAANVSLGDGTG